MPKTGSVTRTVRLDEDVAAALRRQEGRLAWGPAWVDSGTVFVREDGAPLHPSAVPNRFLKLRGG